MLHFQVNCVKFLSSVFILFYCHIFFFVLFQSKLLHNDTNQPNRNVYTKAIREKIKCVHIVLPNKKCTNQSNLMKVKQTITGPQQPTATATTEAEQN